MSNIIFFFLLKITIFFLILTMRVISFNQYTFTIVCSAVNISFFAPILLGIVCRPNFHWIGKKSSVCFEISFRRLRLLFIIIIWSEIIGLKVRFIRMRWVNFYGFIYILHRYCSTFGYAAHASESETKGNNKKSNIKTTLDKKRYFQTLFKHPQFRNQILRLHSPSTVYLLINLI